AIKSADIIPGDTVSLVFKEPVDRLRLPVDAIQFDISGTGEWRDDTTYVFTTSDLAPGGVYSYTIKAGLRTQQGGIMVNDVTGPLYARGQIQLASVSPRGNDVSQATQDVKITFNQPVDRSSAESKVSISTGVVQSRYWQGNTLVLRMANFGYQATVRVVVDAGVRPTGFGLANTSPLTFSFTTEARSRRLDVPYYRQAYAQSCEAATLRMALAYRGIQSSDWDILQRFGYAPSHKDKQNNIWGDPQKGFVGDVNGDQRDGTGWGVYAEPVAAATRSFGRSASTIYGVSASFLAQQIYDGNPVILWGIWGGSAEIQTWQTPEGGTVSGPFPMHVRLVTGVVGEPGNPMGFYVHDPITGTSYWSTSQLISNTQKAGA
ncbi:hypothetical protein B7Z17_04440, partial [Candidatus Saccharibacteria bacterium 32-49-10]